MEVATVHFSPRHGELAANRAELVRLARDAATRARAIVLPELATTGFVLGRDEALAWAEPVPGPTTDALSAVARAAGAVIVVGLAVREGERVLRNAQVVLDADGRVAGRYAKRHLWGSDHDWAAAGATPGAVVETAHGRLGLLVCHDVVHPRTVLEVARAGPRLVAFSTAWVSEGLEPFPSAWLQASALLRGAPFVAANRGGEERGVKFEDPSAILVDGVVVARGQVGAGPEVLFAPVTDR